MSDAQAQLTADPKWKKVEAILRRHAHQPTALIEAMHLVQQSWGYLDKAALRRLADALNVPLSKVYGVATFYHLFSLTPAARHSYVVCMGSSCHIKGAPAILKAAQDALEQTDPTQISLRVTRCTGTCALAPLVKIDDEIFPDISPSQVAEQIGRWTQ